MSGMNNPLLFCRAIDGKMYFLCDRCGRVHSHGDVEGSRNSDCDQQNLGNFGNLFASYEIKRSGQKLGRLSEDEAKAAQRLSSHAYSLINETKKFLRVAGVDENSNAAIALTQAEEALRELATIGLRENPFETITDAKWIDDDEQ